MIINLSQLAPGNKGRVDNLLLCGRIRNRLLDLGFTPGTLVETVRKSPLGDPVAYQVRGTLIALRCEESARITVEPLQRRSWDE